MCQCDAFIITSESEAVGLKGILNKPNLFTIQHGVASAPTSFNLNATGGFKTYHNPNIEFLFLSRLHRKKGLDLLVEAWAQLRPQKATLTIVGDGSIDYVEYLQSLIKLHNLQEHIFLSGPAYGIEKWSFFAKAHYFVLPSRSENFGFVVAEALSCGLPVITTSTTPWSFLDEVHAGWCVSPEVLGIKMGLAAALSTNREQWNVMSIEAKRVASRYSWNIAATQICRVYDEITGITQK